MIGCGIYKSMSFFVVVEKNGNQMAYGPFATERSAFLKNITHRSEAELTAWQKGRGKIETYAAVGVSPLHGRGT